MEDHTLQEWRAFRFRCRPHRQARLRFDQKGFLHFLANRSFQQLLSDHLLHH